MVIEFKNSTVGYDKPLVSVDHLKLEQGKVYSLIGPNGSGKSTLLLSIAGIQPFLKSEIYVEQNKVKLQTLPEYIAFVDTKIVSSSQITVFDVLKMGRYKHTNLWHKITVQDQEIIDKWVNQLNLQSLIKRYMNELSDGQKQMVMIARALIEETPVIVLDEPSAFLDVPNTIEVMKILKSAANTHRKTILFTTHDIHTALQISDYVSWIKNGMLQIQSNKPQSQKIPLSSIFNIESGVIDADTGNYKI